jgi:ATP-dependent Zn protease
LKYVNIKGSKNSKAEKENSPSMQYNHEKIDGAIERWMIEAEERTESLIDENWDKVEALTLLLLDKEIMYEEDLREV